jgi:hypothetical protein
MECGSRTQTAILGILQAGDFSMTADIALEVNTSCGIILHKLSNMT